MLLHTYWIKSAFKARTYSIRRKYINMPHIKKKNKW